MENEDQDAGSKSRQGKRFQVLESQGFIVGKSLGQGSYAIVKSAYDVTRKLKVAVKVISKRKAPDDYLTKFLPREIDVIKVLKHPCLIAFYQVIETTTRYFLIMELSEHGDLLEKIRSIKNIPEEQAGLWFRNIHDGMLYMHNKQIVHRDLKCENVLVGSNTKLKITDFGFAKRMSKHKNGETVMSETYCGSYAYAPPEILRGSPYDAFVADIWSMGVILFTMLYGRLPYDDSNHKKLLKQVQNRVVFPPKPDVSEACRIFILKILMKCQDRIPLSSMKFDPWFKKIMSLDESKVVKDENIEKEEEVVKEKKEVAVKTELPKTVDIGFGSANVKYISQEKPKDEHSQPIFTEEEKMAQLS